MYCRVPRTVEVGKEIGRIGLDYGYEKIAEIANDPLKLKEHYKKFCNNPKNSNISFNDFSKMTKNISRNNYDVNEKFVIALTFSLTPEIFTQLMQMYWNLYIAKRQHFFITNDTPLNVFIYEEEKKKAIFGGGFADSRVEVNFPISPKMSLGLDRKNKGTVVYVDEPFIRERNRRTAIMAEQYIIASLESNRIKRLLSEFSWTYKKPKMDYNVIIQKWKESKTQK